MKHIVASLVAFALVSGFTLRGEDLPPKVRAVAAWQMSANVGLAMALFESNGTEDIIRPIADKAFKAARALDIQLPAPPEKSGKRAEDGAAIMKFLLKDCGKAMSEKLAKGPEAAIAEIGLKSGVLLIIYGPGDESGKTIAKVIEERGKTAELPEALTATLVKKIRDGAPNNEVKDAVLDLHEKVNEHLVGIAKAAQPK